MNLNLKMKRIVNLIVAALVFAVAAAKPFDEAKALYDSGQYDEAIAKFNAILKSAPRDVNANYYLGLSYLAKGEKSKAISPLAKAEDRGSKSAARALAEIALGEYRVDDASKHIDTWEKLIKKERKVVIPESLERLRSKVVATRNMLERVEKIAIIDSLTVDSTDFFKHYKLSAEAGRLLAGDVLPLSRGQEAPSVVYVPESNKEVFWATPDASGMKTLKWAQILDDGTFEDPKPFDTALNEGGDADFFFLTTDGVTFYYASNGESSLGGYDIFMSRRDADGEVLQPQNVGMPFNSPFNDFLLVIDEAAGLGWWATDRNQVPGKVTIYTFVPNDTRVNYAPDDPGLADYALVRDISSTNDRYSRDEIEAMLSNPILAEQTSKGGSERSFALSLGNGKVYTSLSQFRNPQARNAMKQCLDQEKEMAMIQSKLDMLRKHYAQGDHTVASDILDLERRMISARKAAARLRNVAISQEKR